MKKKIEADLISIAHRILQLKDHTTLTELQEEARVLYEKLTILNFAETHFAGPQPTIGQVRAVLEQMPEEGLSTTPPTEATETIKTEPQENLEDLHVEKVNEIVTRTSTPSLEILEKPSETIADAAVQITKESPKKEIETITKKEVVEEHKDVSEDKPEFIIDKVNESISEDLFVPATADEINAILRGETITKSPIAEPEYQKNDIEDIAPKTISNTDQPKSLNDKLKKNINIGLNDRLAFIKHLFEGSSADYNRVLSQLNTMDSAVEALDFIQTRIKPDHNNWENKEEYEQRFLKIVNSKFE